MEPNILETFAYRYPQLTLPIAEGMSKTKEYRDTVLRGKPAHRLLRFMSPDEIASESVQTLAGTVEILFFPEREDFLHAYRALGYRCEPAPIPDSVGAGIIDGLADWEKIKQHRAEYETAKDSDWPAEFRRFTAVKKNYCGALILLSSDAYSAIPADWLGIAPEEWMRNSIIIRKYHEMCHFICRRLWPEKKDALRDEVYADAIGLLAAFGEYNLEFAKIFLGIEGESFREGGRLSHYAGDNLPTAVIQANALIDEVEARIKANQTGDLWETLESVY